MERLVKEAEELAGQGVKELILVAQETTLYGKDLYGEKYLHMLLKKLCKIKGLRWIRILYCYPEEIDDNLIQVMKEEEKICHYLDLPIQHASDDILKRMGRRTSKQELVHIVEKLRREIPDIALRTTLITGFPGEKEERQAELMELQQDIVFSQADEMAGREVLVMVEGKVADENAYVGRTYKDAPNVDGFIFINTEEELMSGDFARVRVTGALEYDLIGELIS